jgi:hypothetical protein
MLRVVTDRKFRFWDVPDGGGRARDSLGSTPQRRPKIGEAPVRWGGGSFVSD